MNTDMDDLIRDAVRRQEQLAVDPARIRAALPARAARRRRTRTLVTVAAAVMAVVAVLVPVIAVPGQGNGSGPAVFAAPEPTTIPMLYRPTWLPDGMVEESRAVPLTPNATFAAEWEWKSASWRVSLLVAFEKASNSLPETNIDINGKPGRYLGGENLKQVGWQADENTRLWVTTESPEMSEEVLFQIARSVRPDPTRLRPPIRLDWLPGDLDGTPVLEVAREEWPARWSATIALESGDKRSLSVAVEGTDPPGQSFDETVTINGGTAHLDKDMLTMDLGDGRQLVVRSWSSNPLTRAELIRVAENVQLDPNPDVAWLGR